MSRQEIENHLATWDVRKEVVERIKRSGLPIPLKPTEPEAMSTEWNEMNQQHGGLSNIPFDELGNFLGKWDALTAYARYVEAVADLEQTAIKERKDHVKSQLYVLSEGTREIRYASCQSDPLYVGLQHKFEIAEATYTAMRALREGYEGKVNVISREITRRGNELQGTRLSSNRGGGA
ncbi:hypothetical protein DFP93_101306 [Aneurinibacillus soli]|uniref:Uncharacterized protein n=1 Tax=Aneurinibacillus soli TaxID=1500254 RepID=A0A0U5AWX9_9BACL|nr:hypothetical protein [Aneurinibacillus soli]PYE64280.1 hypothetical protein DFP93_101306 [Aneurinibacillus soli]BAU28229.1 hypothetical protein CB4_02403 [Aneurinibacillus soli]